jgi:putative DNA primase/helicase
MKDMKPLAALERSEGSERIAAMGSDGFDHTAGVPVAERFPACLTKIANAPRWCVWAWKTRTGKDGAVKRTKPPLCAIGGRAGGFARNDDPTTWATYSEASAALAMGGLDGIGLQLLDLLGFVALDLDNVRDKATGALLPWAADLVARAHSYVEVTPSGEGLRILGRVAGGFPPTHRKQGHEGGGSFEIYANLVTGRYITVTGDRLPDAPDVLADLDALVAGLPSPAAPDSLPPAPLMGGWRRAFDALPAELRAQIASANAADRSAAFQTAVNRLRRCGVTEADAAAMFNAHPNGPARKYIDGGRLEGELRRSWDKAETAGPAADDPAMAQEIQRLAELPRLAYEAARAQAAKDIGLRVSFLDAEVTKRRPPQPDPNGAEAFLPPELWPDPVDGAAVADEIRRALLAHVVFQSPAHADAATLWILGTYLMDVWSLWPKLLLRSPEKRCGKTTTLEVIEAHVCAALMTANITAAALFRSIEKWRPTLIIDEADRFLSVNEEANGIINAGHTRRSAYVMRVEEIDGVRNPVRFSVWGAQAVACIGAQMDTLEDRSIRIDLRRKLTSEKVSKASSRLYDMRLPLRQKAMRWAQDNAARLEADEREPPACGSDRAQDNWTPLWRLAWALGGPWPDRAATAYTLMESREKDPDTDSAGVMLLRDLWEIFEGRGVERLASATILGELLTLEDRPWGEWQFGRTLTSSSMAKLLKPFDVRSGKHRFGSSPQRGYQRAEVEEAHRRYCVDSAGTLEQ